MKICSCSSPELVKPPNTVPTCDRNKVVIQCAIWPSICHITHRSSHCSETRNRYTLTLHTGIFRRVCLLINPLRSCMMCATRPVYISDHTPLVVFVLGESPSPTCHSITHTVTSYVTHHLLDVTKAFDTVQLGGNVAEIWMQLLHQ